MNSIQILQSQATRNGSSLDPDNQDGQARDPIALSRALGERVRIARTPGDDKIYADALLKQLQCDRIIWAVAPKAIGGFDLTLKDAAQLAFNIARHSGSAGLIYAMHTSQALSVIRHGGDDAFFRDFLQRMVREQTLIASGTSEKGVGGDIFASICTIGSLSAEELFVEKDSPNISYLDHAGAVLITAMREGSDKNRSQVLVAAEIDRMDLKPGRGAGFLGMRGILNRSYHLSARFAPEAIFPEPYPLIARETMTPSIHILWAALWSGIAHHVLRKTKAFIAKENYGDEAIAAHARSDLARLIDRHFTMNVLIRDAAAAYDRNESAEAMGLASTAEIKRLKIVCSELLEEICLGALSLVGIRGYAEDGPYSLSEPLRDALSAKVMVSNFRLRGANAAIERFVDERL